jgi:hypothetical protein
MLTSITTVNSPRSTSLIHSSHQHDYMHALCEWNQASFLQSGNEPAIVKHMD